MSFYDQLGKRLDYLKHDKIKKVRQAYLMALKCHADQTRASGEKYITHPVAVAKILIKMHIDYQSIVAALLHDTLEDTATTKEEITAKFGDTVANLVDGVTKLTQIESTNKNEAQAQYFRKMILAMSRDIRVILIKLADRLHNMQTIYNISLAARKRMARETLDIYAPIANRLSMYEIYAQLEDLSFAALYPHRYASLYKAVEKTYGKNKEVIMLLNQDLHRTFAKTALKNVKIMSRMKHIYGIYKKMLNHQSSFANITDIYAFRIIVQNVEDCYRALGIVHSLYKPIVGKIKDHIAMPKFNGYQSLHTLLIGPYGTPVEIQIRTQIMEQTASEGIAAHWLYKTKGEVVDEVHMRTQQWVNKLLEMQQQTNSSIEFFESFKIDLFPDKVYLFTPKGDIIELAQSATVVDFAYAIHTKIGNSCVSARINGKSSPPSTILESGQTVTIMTGKKEDPNPAWLSFVVTTKARNSIRQYLRNKDRQGLILLGKRLLDKACTDLGGTYYNIRPMVFDTLSSNLGFQRISDLFENIGLGNHLAVLIAYQLIYGNQPQNKVTINKDTRPLLICGAEEVGINFVNCCYPLPGDDIIGYLHVGRGLDIHTKNCSHLQELLQSPEKCLPVKWVENIQGDFRVALSVELSDEIGALAQLAQAVSQTKASIYNINVDARTKNSALFTLLLLVKNATHLERVKRHIGNVPSVVGIARKQN